MKKYIKILSIFVFSSIIPLLTACSGDSDFTENEDTAPATLDKTRLQLFEEGMNFNFIRTAGDATTSEGEVGYCPAFSQSSSLSTTFVTDSGSTLELGLPTFVSNVTYTYHKVGTNSGQLQLTGNGVGDDVDYYYYYEDEEYDFFVNQEDGSPFIADILISFATDGTSISAVSTEVSVIGTSSYVNSSISYTSQTGDGVQFTLHDGSDVPTLYDLNDSTYVVSDIDASLVPEGVSGAGSLEMYFDTGNSVLSYFFSTFLESVDQGFDSADEQGITQLSAVYSDGSAAAGTNTTYAYYEDVENDTQATLLVQVPDPLDVTSFITEKYELTFQSIESGVFTQTQPDNTGTVQGTFTFPFLEASE